VGTLKSVSILEAREKDEKGFRRLPYLKGGVQKGRGSGGVAKYAIANGVGQNLQN